METSQRIARSKDYGCAPPNRMPAAVLWLQGITLVWMLVETAASLYSALEARMLMVGGPTHHAQHGGTPGA
jgi:hypothetical protein